MRSKKMGSAENSEMQQADGSLETRMYIPKDRRPTHVSLSLPLTPEIEKIRGDLFRVAVLSLVEGFINEASVLEVAPTIINKSLAGPITPLNDCCFLVPLANREEVKEVCRFGTAKVATKDGPCTLRISPWSAEIGADGGPPARDNGQLSGTFPSMDGVGIRSLRC